MKQLASFFWSVIWLGGIVTDSQAKADAVSLFNGNDLSGWYGHNPHQTAKLTGAEREAAIEKAQKAFRDHWRVIDGELVNDGHGPYATSVNEYGDIELELEYRTVAKADSGIYLRGTPQVQIWDYTEAGGKWKIGADKGSGGLYNNRGAGRTPFVLADRPFGEWNQLRILQLGSRTTVHLNNKRVVDKAIWENFWDKDRKQPLAPKGPIHLQTHGGEIRWRNLLVREISGDEANMLLRGSDADQGFESIFNGKDLEGWRGAVSDYEVKDGAIMCKQGRGGNLFTQASYEDFIVRLEFNLPPGGNNGLAIRYPGEGGPSSTAMCELQVLDNTAAKYAELDARQYHGSAYGMVPAFRGYLRPPGQWNYQEVTVRGSRLKVELNGSVILDADLSDVTEFMGDAPHPGKDRTAGHFGFAGHNDPVKFRRLAIKRL